MAAPLPGSTPLLLSSLALHLLFLGPLFALTSGTTGGLSHTATTGHCYRDAGKVYEQRQPHQREDAGESPTGNWDLRPSKWNIARIQTWGCSGVHGTSTYGGCQQNAGRGTRKDRLEVVGTLWRDGDCPPPGPRPPHPIRQGRSSRSSTDGVGAGKGVDRWKIKNRGVDSPLISPAFTSLPVQNGKKRALQRTRACAQWWPAPGPHLTKRGAARVFVRALGLCRAPGSRRIGGEVWERVCDVRMLFTKPGSLNISIKAAQSPAFNFSHSHSPAGRACCVVSEYNSLRRWIRHIPSKLDFLFINASEALLRSNLYHNHFSNEKDTTISVYRSKKIDQAWTLDEVTACVLRGAGNWSYSARHSNIDPRIKEKCDDSCTAGCIARRERSVGDGQTGGEARTFSAPIVINPRTAEHLVGFSHSTCDGNAGSYYHAIIMNKRRGVDKLREGNYVRGRGERQSNKHMELSNYPDKYLAFPILTLPDNVLHHNTGQSRRTRGGESNREVGGGYTAEFIVPVGGITQRNLPLQFTDSSVTGTRGHQSDINAIHDIRHHGTVLTHQSETQRGNDAKSFDVSKASGLTSAKVSATSERESAAVSDFVSAVTFPDVVSASSRRAAITVNPNALRDHATASKPSFFSEMNLTVQQYDDSARLTRSRPATEISARRTAPENGERAFLWHNLNTNNNNNNANEGDPEQKDHNYEKNSEKRPWRGQREQGDLWESAQAGCAHSISPDCEDTAQSHMQLKSGEQVSLAPEGVRQSDRQQMGPQGERDIDAEWEGEALEGSAAVAVGGGVLQVGVGKRKEKPTGGREPGGEGQKEEEWERRKGITKASWARANEGAVERRMGENRDSNSSNSTEPGRERMEKADRMERRREAEEANKREEEEKRHSSMEQSSLERLIIAGDDKTSQGEGEEKNLMLWSRSRRAANRHPFFPQYNYQVQVAENQPPGTSVIVMSASDPDPGDAGRVSYSMAPLMNSRSSDYFHIHPETGLITTTQILDREHMDLHYFRVTATDYGSSRLSGTTMVAITVSDRNDHSPIFEQTEYRETIRENVEEGYPILQLRATDSDSPTNANIRYRFIGDMVAVARAAFEIDPRSGLITTRGVVDRELNEHYTLQVEASDQGKEPGPRSATVKVFITVLDENDNVPQFSEKRYVVAVKENVRPHSEILRVSATDHDKDSNAAVHYNIISGNSRGQFSIDSITGEIQVVAPLDYEAEREYTLRVRAQDNGRPPLSNNTGIVSVQVTDVNDNPPIFVSTPFQASVLESSPVGSSILHIQAIDTDSGDNARLEYKLTGTSSDTPFIINSATGWVTVRSTLDRESVEHYFFGVEARDYGMPPLSATASVTITVMDVNDNHPEFLQKEYYARLNEDAAVGTSVVTVTAVDRDVNSAVTYQITGGNTRNRFAISTAGGAGLLSLALPLDYKQERRYVLTVTASDRTLHDTCQVHINITDANTHRPVFQSAHYSVSVNEDSPPGSLVVVISATDDDVGENARITYLLEDNIPQFRIDSATGAITLQAELDYEDQMTYTLAITAKDNGIPQKSDTTYVEVNVNDVNDNAPQFLSPRYQGSVSEDAPPFTSVLQISATDRDAHANGRVQYTFQNGEDGDGDFTIEPTSGILRTVRRLDRESVPFYELTAYAVDRGVPPQRTPVHIQVTVLDVNDNAPVFPADDFEVLVKENSAVGSVVAQITATDPDEGANAQIMYQIVEGNIPEIFQMDIFSGELTSLIDLDYETRNEYVIVVQATSAPLVSRATVRIKLVDQNDNRPTLQDFQIIFNNFVSNRSNSFPSSVIGRIPAHDPDVSDKLYYTIDRGNELHLLLLNHTSGEIRLSRKLDNNRPLVAPMLITVTGKRP